MAYVLWRERVDADARLAFTAAAFSRALGHDVPLVTPDEAVDDWYGALCAVPAVATPGRVVNPDESTLRAALGLGQR